jgi:acetyl esterase/lipase
MCLAGPLCWECLPDPTKFLLVPVAARMENLAGLAPAFIAVGSIDLFVEEDLEYARRLMAVGVPTEVHVVPGAYHAFDLLVPQAAVTARFIEYWTVALKRAFGTV